MEIKCIDNNNGAYGLTVNQMYELINETDNWYHVRNDKNIVSRYAKKYFTKESYTLTIQGTTVTIRDQNNQIVISNSLSGVTSNQLACCGLYEVSGIQSFFKRLEESINKARELEAFLPEDTIERIINLAVAHLTELHTDGALLFTVACEEGNEDYDGLVELLSGICISESDSFNNSNTGNQIVAIIISKQDWTDDNIKDQIINAFDI